jgi:heterodisulfide reductase subunit C
MSKFGYTKLDSGVVNLDTADRSFAQKVLELEHSFAYCIACGSCAATCSAGNFTDYNLRQIQLMVRRGEVEPLRKTITRCMLCGKCQMVCPKGVSTRNIVLQVSKLLKQPASKNQLTDKLHATDDRKI